MTRRNPPPAEPRPEPRELVASAPPSQLAGSLNDAAKAFLDESQGDRQVPASIPIITVSHREGEFILPSGEVATEISGYPIYYFQTRRWYARSPQPGEKGKPPDCWSPDLLKPSPDALDKQSELCAGCPMSEWGSARDGKSQSCSMQTWLFLINPDFGSPPLGVLVLPPSSIRPLIGTRMQAGYLGRCQAKYGVYEIVWTTLRLRQEGDPRQVAYSVIDPVMGEPAEMERARQLSQLRNQFLAMMNSVRGQTASVPASVEEDLR